MDWRDHVTLGDLYDYYIENRWYGSAALIKQQGEEIDRRIKKELGKKRSMCAQCETVSSQDSCPNCGSKEITDIMLCKGFKNV